MIVRSFDDEVALQMVNQALERLIDVLLADGLITEESAKEAEQYAAIFTRKSWIRRAWQNWLNLPEDKVSVLIVKRC